MKRKGLLKRVFSGFMASIMLAGSMDVMMPVNAQAHEDCSVSANDVDQVQNSEVGEPENYDIAIDGHYYKVFTDYKTWAEAENACEELGGHLITVNNEEELAYICGLGKMAWLGGFRDNFFNWYWVTGEAFTYEKKKAPWNTNEPNSIYYDGENRLELVSGGFNDASAGVQLQYVCEWDDINPDTYVIKEDPDKLFVRKLLENSSDENSPLYSIGTHKYYVFNFYKSITWNDAEAFCESIGGHLFTVTNEDEVAYNKKLITVDNLRGAWIGGFKDSRRNWAWITGESWDFVENHCDDPDHKVNNKHPKSCDKELWEAGEPNHDSATATGRAEIKDYAWNDLSERETLTRFVCEWDDYKKFLSPSEIEKAYELENCSKGEHMFADGTPYLPVDADDEDYDINTTHIRRCYLCDEVVEIGTHEIVNTGSGDKHSGVCKLCGYEIGEAEHELNDEGQCEICGINSLKDQIEKSIIKVNYEKLTYNGQAQKPVISLTVNDNELEEDVDFSYEVTEETNAGQYKTVISGLGKYYDTYEFTWEIEKILPTITLSDLSNSYGAVVGAKADITPAEAKEKLVIEYKSENGNWSKNIPSEIGKYSVRAYTTDDTVNTAKLDAENAVTGTFEIVACQHNYDGQTVKTGENKTHYKECALCKDKLTEACVPSEPVKENEVKESYEEVVYCSICKQELSREKFTNGEKDEKPESSEEKEDKNPEEIKDNSSVNQVNGTLTTDVNGKTVFNVTLPENVTYTGKAITFPSNIVATDKDGKTITLAAGNDYKVYYLRNKNVGTAKITIKGLKTYRSKISYSGTFKINPVNISEIKTCNVVAGDITIDGNKKGKTKVDPKIYFGAKRLKLAKDYKLSVIEKDGNTSNYYKNRKFKDDCQIKITGVKNFTGEQIINVTFTNPEEKKALMSDSRISGSSKYEYTGKPVELDFSRVTVKVKGTTLKFGEDFTIEYYNNVNVGTATAILKALPGSTKVAGTRQIYYTICGKNISKTNVTMTLDGKTVGLGSLKVKVTGDSIKPVITIKDGSKVLTENVDYTVEFSKNRNIGTAQVKITGIGGYLGTKTVKFGITK